MSDYIALASGVLAFGFLIGLCDYVMAATLNEAFKGPTKR